MNATPETPHDDQWPSMVANPRRTRVDAEGQPIRQPSGAQRLETPTA